MGGEMKERCDGGKEREREGESVTKKKKTRKLYQVLVPPDDKRCGLLCVLAVGETLKNCYFCIPSNFRGLSSFKKNP